MQVQDQIKSIIESILFISEKPMSADKLQHLLSEYTVEQVQAALHTLTEEYSSAQRGIELAKIDDAYQFRTRASNAEWILRFTKEKPVRLGRASLETLSIIAYRQPITRPEVDEIRGVDSGHIIRTLIERNLVKILGKREEAGNPLVYGTTPEFLHFFHLDSLSDLPSLREYTELGEESLKKLEALLPGSDSPENTDNIVAHDGPAENITLEGVSLAAEAEASHPQLKPETEASDETDAVSILEASKNESLHGPKKETPSE